MQNKACTLLGFAAVQAFFDTVFPARGGERKLSLLLFFHSLLAVGAFVAGRSVRDALFMAHSDRAALAWMYVASAAAVMAIGLLYSPLVARARRDLLALGSAAVFSALYVVLFFVEHTGHRWVYSALYIYVEITGALSLMQFWTLANELFHAREAKRLYGFIGSGGLLSNVVVGLATSAIATRFGAAAVLLLCAALLALCAGVSFAAGRVGRARIIARAVMSEPTRKTPQMGGAARVFASPHLRAVAALAWVTFFTTTLVDFAFKVVSAQAYPKDQLAAFFGHFYAAVGACAVLLHLFGTRTLLNRIGVVGALALLPLSLGLGTAGLALLPIVATAAFSKGADTLFRYSVNDATTQLLYLPVPPQSRASSKAFIDGVVKSSAIGLAGLALLAYRYLFNQELRPLGWVGFLFCIVWGALVVRLRRHYIQSLQDTLRQRRMDLTAQPYGIQDSSTGRALMRALESENPREVLNALELLPNWEGVRLDERVAPLLDAPQPELRIAALRFYGKQQAMQFANAVFHKFDDESPEVRAAAVDAFCSIGREKAVRSVRALLADPDVGIQSAAITGMIRHGGLDGVLAAAEALKALIGHPESSLRVYAARVLGDIGVRNFYQPVLELMSDSSPEVQRCAIQAAGRLGSPELVLPLIYKTRAAETTSEAVEALSLYGAPIAPVLAKVLSNKGENVVIRRAVARVLGRLDALEAVSVLTPHLEEPDEELRMRLYRALARVARSGRMPSTDRKQVEAALEMELQRAYRALASAHVLQLGAGPDASTPRSGKPAAAALLASALTDKVARTEQRIFLLLSVLYPESGMEHIWAGIRDAGEAQAARRRANAVELLDNLLDRRLKRRLLPLVEEQPREQKLQAVAEIWKDLLGPRDQTVLALCRDENAWVRSCALFFAAETDLLGAEGAITEAGGDVHLVVRETSLMAAERAVPLRAGALARLRLGDESAVVRRQAERIAQRG